MHFSRKNGAGANPFGDSLNGIFVKRRGVLGHFGLGAQKGFQQAAFFGLAGFDYQAVFTAFFEGFSR